LLFAVAGIPETPATMSHMDKSVAHNAVSRLFIPVCTYYVIAKSVAYVTTNVQRFPCAIRFNSHFSISKSKSRNKVAADNDDIK
jgi:hypothetical protein